MAKKKLTVWADEEVVNYLQLESTREGVSLSEAANNLLKKSLLETKELSGSEMISLTLKNELRREFTGLANRITSLMSRAALEATSARYLSVQTLAHLLEDEGEAKGYNRTAWLFAVDQLKRPSSEFRQLLKEWRDENGDDSPPGEAWEARLNLEAKDQDRGQGDEP